MLGKQGEEELGGRAHEVDVTCISSLFASVCSTNNGDICLLYGDAELSSSVEYRDTNIPSKHIGGSEPKACFFAVRLVNQADASCIVERQCYSNGDRRYSDSSATVLSYSSKEPTVGKVLAICMNEYSNAVGVISLRGSYWDGVVSNPCLNGCCCLLELLLPLEWLLLSPPLLPLPEWLPLPPLLPQPEWLLLPPRASASI